VFHHFGSKEALFAEALEAEVLALRRYQQDLNLRDLEPRTAIRQLVESTFDFFLNNPSIITFLNIENRLGGEHMRRSTASVEAYNPLLDSIGLILERGVEQGIFRPEVDALALYLSIAGMSYHYVSNRHTLGAVFARDLGAPEEVSRRRAQIVDFVLHAIAAH
jgi:TetR/AcrR family transcriptional regulator